MTITDLSPAQLRKLIRLIQQKESIQAKLAKVDAALSHLDGAAVAPSRGYRRNPPRRNGTTVKDSILKVLGQAGRDGLSVKEIAAQAKAKEGSVSVWVYTEGKKVKGLKKVGRGKFAYYKSN